jgi:hypothetical protein
VVAIVFLAVIFITKNTTIFKNENNALTTSDGLVYTTEPIGELVNKDTDLDGILDWEEALWGTDPTKKDTDGDGVNDDVEIAKLKGEPVGSSSDPAEEEKLTETEKLARKLFTTAAALSQGGVLDEAAINEIGSSLAENLLNTPQKKVFTLANIKTVKSDSKEAVQKYARQLADIQAKNPLGGPENVPLILIESFSPEGETDTQVLKKLDPIVAKINAIIKDLSMTDTPVFIVPMHLLVINTFQKMSENLVDLKLVDYDPIVAFSAINKYEGNIDELDLYLKQLFILLNLKLNS